MAAVRLPKIGTVIRLADGSYDLGPIPNIGGPFDTAAEFFLAWASHAKYPLPEATVRQRCGEYADKILSSIEVFPRQVKSLAKSLSSSNGGPFPLYHPDFLHSNIIVDDDYNVLSIIDWEGAWTVPWELVDFPQFLCIVPPPMDSPSNYDINGEPTDFETRQAMQDRAEYLRLVGEAEMVAGTDAKLSSVLGNEISQHLAYTVREYTEGKMGFYDNVLLPMLRDRQPGGVSGAAEAPSQG